jgi:fermentation-respiration switch protein FrsA (DUF1100 family)
MRILYTVLGFCLLLYLVYVGYFWVSQQSILFPRHLLHTPPAPAEGHAGLERIWLEVEQGRVEAWYLPPFSWDAGAPAPLLIVGHGNGELIDYWLQRVARLRQMGIGVLLVEFPGYGRSQGVPTQAAIGESFVAAYDAIVDHPAVDPQRIVLFGFSMGGAAVALLATERPSAGLILVSTFTNVRSLAARHYLPGFGVRDPFDTLSAVSAYPGPVLVIHGTDDRLIPYSHGAALYDAAADAELISLACGHNNCVGNWDAFWQSLRPFLARAGILS